MCKVVPSEIFALSVCLEPESHRCCVVVAVRVVCGAECGVRAE